MVPRTALVGVALALGGCDIVLGLERPAFQTVCGTFGAPREVRFDDGLEDIADLSFDRDHVRGFVRATNLGRRGPTPVIFDADAEVWRHDVEREANLADLQLMNNGIRFARLGRNPDELYASQTLSVDNKLHVYNYTFTTGQWLLVRTQEVAATTQVSSFAGGELEIPQTSAPMAPTTNYLPLFRTADDLSMRVAIVVRNAGESTWDPALANGEQITDQLNEQHAPLAGALARTEGRRILVYSARPAGQRTGADLYIAEQFPGEAFSAGVPLRGFNTDQEELEPYLSPDCMRLTFRRVPSGAQTEDENMLVGGTIYEAAIVDATE